MGKAGRQGAREYPKEVREVLVEIARRLAEAPGRAGELVRRRKELGDQLHDALESLKAREVEVAGAVASERGPDGKPAFPNEALRAAEVLRRLAEDPGYRLLKARAEGLRAELRGLEAEAEELGRRHRSDASLAGLVASLLAAGLSEEAQAVLHAYAEGCGALEAPGAEGTGASEEPRKAPLEEGVFRVLEVRLSAERDTARAVACVTGGEKLVFHAVGAAAKALAGALGRDVVVKYRRHEKGLLAVSVGEVA